MALAKSPDQVHRTWFRDKRVFFKYYGAARALQTLRESAVWFARLSALNDPDEGLYRTVVRDYFAGEHPTYGVTASEMAEMHMLYSAASRDEVDGGMFPAAFFCLSQNPLIPEMWTHYSDGETGLVIAFDTGFDPFRISRRSVDTDTVLGGHTVWANAVRYSDSIPSIPIDTVPHQAIAQAASTKSRRWHYEEEFRICRTMTMRKGKQLPKGEAVTFNRAAIAGVIFGRSTSPTTRDSVAAVLRAHDMGPALLQVHSKAYSGSFAVHDLG